MSLLIRAQHCPKPQSLFRSWRRGQAKAEETRSEYADQAHTLATVLPDTQNTVTKTNLPILHRTVLSPSMGHTAPLTCNIVLMISLPHGLRAPIDVATSPDYRRTWPRGPRQSRNDLLDLSTWESPWSWLLLRIPETTRLGRIFLDSCGLSHRCHLS